MDSGNSYKLTDGGKSQWRYKQHLCSLFCGMLVFAVGIAIGVIIGYFIPGPNANCPQNVPQPLSEPQGNKPELTTTPEPKPSPGTKATFCPNDQSEIKKAISGDRGIFEVLTTNEMSRVRNVLVQKGIVTIPRGRPTLTDGYIYGMSLYLPSKKPALEHLDSGGPSPGRYAEVHVHRGNLDKPDVMEYKVGPVDSSSMTVHQLLKDGEVHYNARPRDSVEYNHIIDKLKVELMPLRKLMMESFDGAYFSDGGLTVHIQSPPGLTPEVRESRFLLQIKIDETSRGQDLHPLPLTGTLHNAELNVSKWYTHSFYYLNQGPFATAQELLQSYNNGTIRKFAFPKGYRKTLFQKTFPKPNSDKPRRFSTTKAPPRTYNPDGPRFTVNGHDVEWMGYSMTFGGSQFRGPSVHNVKFKGERIVYENSLSECNLIYASDTSSSANTIYMDATFGFGEFQDLIPTVDCPEHGTILDATWWDVSQQKPVSASSICIYESDGEEPLWRRKDRFVGGLRNTFLVVRYPMAVGNYDYIIDYKFYLDGKMETTVTASGYIQASFWDPENPHTGTDKMSDMFGFRIGDYSHGSLHDHTFGFKVDLDVGGTQNTFEKVHWKAGDVLKAFQTQTPDMKEKPVYFLYNKTRYLEYELIATEQGMNVDMARPEFWTVGNNNNKNKWGVRRAYHIIHNTIGSQTLPHDHIAMKAVAYTKYHCLVTKHKDDERSVSGAYDQNRLLDPIGSIDRYVDGENITDEDIVTWLSFGFLHVPTSEDFPMTIRNTAGFVLKPFNYFDSSMVFDVPNYIDTKSNIITERVPNHGTCAEPSVKMCYFC
ncbi:amiloride-sensitive amine oxidase [copper-containing]-like [Gigantopelta aegis]|uniref:amiloride-sensitive amine oxidase [copper-containing]-like n=1 Tax=Gigantopelta aegis TaxID=1735272 RepID=UPI001B88A36D|nr:amiloride-sensitive amine oxidase [copper-containing]-like [Gigantopelta aegis]XP_041348646.1 amiloride-sensitive amine oxidase [copper-containing]-like [Gigantopelta aegis]